MQQHHIDYLLEEEFCCNPDFLSFFLKSALANLTDQFKQVNRNFEDFIHPGGSWECGSVRSATTEEGETDILILYHSADSGVRVAILIEDKIHAIFQPRQSERYQVRGSAGLASSWDYFFTCLVAPQKYASDNRGFDTRISLETLKGFFTNEDKRSHFKAAILQWAIQKLEITGVQSEYTAITAFRAAYAIDAAAFFGAGGRLAADEVSWQEPGVAWRDDTWFRFTSTRIPSGTYITHKAREGFVDLSFPNTNATVLQASLDKSVNAEGIIAEQTGKSASLRVKVTRITDFADYDSVKAVVVESLEFVHNIVAFIQMNESWVMKALAERAAAFQPTV